jgi:hypothetical protein
MAGQPGRSGGHNRLDAAEHLRRGTFRPSRHGARPTGPALPPPPPVPDGPEPVPAALLEGLTARGRAFVEQCWDTYSGWSPASLALLHEAGRLLDELERVRGQKAERGAQRLLLSVLAALPSVR